MREKVSQVQELFELDDDKCISVLRHFKWDLEKFQSQWLDRSANLSKQIGIEFDTNIPKKFPFVNATLRANNQGYCIICYG